MQTKAAHDLQPAIETPFEQEFGSWYRLLVKTGQTPAQAEARATRYAVCITTRGRRPDIDRRGARG